MRNKINDNAHNFLESQRKRDNRNNLSERLASAPSRTLALEESHV